MAAILGCSLCGCKNPNRRRLLRSDKTDRCKNVATAFEHLVDLKAERMNCSLSTEEKSRLLNGFVCNTCFKVLENYHTKQEELLSRLSAVFDGLSKKTESSSSLFIRKRPSKQSVMCHKFSKKADKPEGKSPDVTVSIQVVLQL